MLALCVFLELQILEDRLSDKKEALLEKELVLEEVTSLTKKLRKHASDGRAEAVQLSKKVIFCNVVCLFWGRPTVCGQCAASVRAMCEEYAKNVRPMCDQCANNVRTMCEPCANHVRTMCKQYANNVLT